MKQKRFQAGDFNAIKNLNKRADKLWANGKYVDERFVYGEYHIKMYALYDFFVEVWVNIEREMIEKIVALDNEKDWEGYLQSVKLSKLLK